MRILTTILLCFAALAAQAQESQPKGAELAFVSKLFWRIQERSFAQNKELCGYIGYDRDGQLDMTRIMTGQEASCYLPNWPEDLVVIASFHTHSTYSPEYDSELPSSIDMESDSASQIDGWVATPGGRLWYIDSDAMTAYEICGPGCLPQDPHFIADPPGTIRSRYSYRAIVKREAR